MAGRRVRLAEVGEQAVESIERRDSLNRVDGVLDGVSAGPRAGRFDPPAHQNLPLQHPTATRRRFLILLVIAVLAVVWMRRSTAVRSGRRICRFGELGRPRPGVRCLACSAIRSSTCWMNARSE